MHTLLIFNGLVLYPSFLPAREEYNFFSPMSQELIETAGGFFTLGDLGIFLALGAVAGTLAGLLGIGGGLIIVPVLLWMFQYKGMDPSVLVHLAVGTSLATIVVTSVASIIAHHRRGAVHWRVVALLVPGVVVGAWMGAVAADLLPSIWLRRVFGCFAILVGLQMAFALQVRAQRAMPDRGEMLGAGVVIGAISAVVGIGGGSMTVPYLYWNSVNIRNAVATSAACGLPIALAGAVGFLIAGWNEQALPVGATGYLYWPALPGIVLASVLFAPIGAHLAHTLPVAMLKRIFALLLLFVGVKLLFW
jgi:uncharacterized membrane protein YfcA